MVIPPHTIAADPTTTTNFKLFLGGWMSLRHLDKFPELNLEIALAEVWLLEESKENNFARRAWRAAIMLLFDTCLVTSCQSMQYEYHTIGKTRNQSNLRKGQFIWLLIHFRLMCLIIYQASWYFATAKVDAKNGAGSASAWSNQTTVFTCV